MPKMSMICCCMLFTGQLLAQDSRSSSNFPPPAIAPVVYAIETNENISIDGKLNEAAWKDDPVINNFFRIEPRQGFYYILTPTIQAWRYN